MVFTTESEKERELNSMEMGSERSKPLHNFTLPCLKWGSQRQPRCMKLNSAAAGGVSSSDRLSSGSKSESERLRVSKLGIGTSGVGEDGIEAIERKLLIDLKIAAEDLKSTMLRDEIVKEEATVKEKPWNLRTRRGASKAPIGNATGVKADQNLPASNDGDGKWPRPPNAGIEKQEKPKFCVSLSKKEIADDFMAITNRPPPRRPRKRPRAVQKKMDAFFPGLWLSEITADSYKVSENPENPKVNVSLHPLSLPLSAENMSELARRYP